MLRVGGRLVFFMAIAPELYRCACLHEQCEMGKQARAMMVVDVDWLLMKTMMVEVEILCVDW